MTLSQSGDKEGGASDALCRALCYTLNIFEEALVKRKMHILPRVNMHNV